MSLQLSIGPVGGIERARERIKLRASADPSIVVFAPTADEDGLAFCIEQPLADRLRQELAAGGLIWPSVCVLTISAFAVHVDGDCGDESFDQLKAFVAWVLRELGPCRVIDDGFGEDVTAIAYTELQAVFDG